MASQDDVKEVSKGKVAPKRRFNAADWKFIAEYVIEEHRKRKTKRKDLEAHWKEIDRQLAMTPDIEFKYIIKNGTRIVDPNKVWMSEMELPLQAQALEILTADARRMMFSEAGPWFRAHAETTDKYLEGVDFTSIILGDENEVPTQINQDNADKLTEGFLLQQFRQTDFFTRYDRINAESFKYGMGVGRARMETKNIYIHEAKGVRSEKQKIPVLVPVSIKQLYLDDPLPSMHSAQVLGQSHIAVDNIKLENIALAANKGSKDPDDPDGGWMPAEVKKLEDDGNGNVQILEMEGDIVVPRKTVRSVVIPGAIVTVAVGGEGSNAVIRFRFRKEPYSSYILNPYHYEHIDSAYPTSPLMKGRPIQIMATDAANRLMDSAALKNAPPVGYDRSDMAFGQDGGPSIFPYAQWPTTDDIKVHSEVGGEPAAMSAMLSSGINLYAELTGVLPSRIGAQTVSHTTAFAKDAEIQRGASRTVDYVNQTGNGPLTRWLDMSYKMGRDSLDKKISFYIDSYGGFVTVDKKALPEKASFEWFGAGGPAEEQAKQQAKIQSLQTAIQMDQLSVASGGPSTLDIPSAIREVLREGKWTDVDAITRLEGAPGGGEAPPGDAGTGEVNPGTISTALQGIAFGQ